MSASATAATAPVPVDPFEYTLPTREYLLSLMYEKRTPDLKAELIGLIYALSLKKARPSFRLIDDYPDSFIVELSKIMSNGHDFPKEALSQLASTLPADIELKMVSHLDSLNDENFNAMHDELLENIQRKTGIKSHLHEFYCSSDDEYRGEFYEINGDWDLRKPSTVMTHEEITNPPKGSALYQNKALLRALSILRVELRVTSLAPNFRLVITQGPDSERRQKMWVEDDAQRRWLAVYLATIPGVTIDMKNDPMCPWLGMKFYHGSRSKYLQTQTPVEISANAQSSKNYNVCQLHWGSYFDDIGRLKLATAFTTPYHTKCFAYGSHIYTYKLSVDGQHLRMLDLRNDYRPDTHNHPELDPFKIIYELAGIKHGGSDRVEKVCMLQQLFEDSSIHGAILNSDVEWVWFDPSSVLEWVPPNPNDAAQNTRTETRLCVGWNEESERAEDVEKEFIITQEEDDRGGLNCFEPDTNISELQAYSLERILFNRYSLTASVVSGRIMEWIKPFSIRDRLWDFLLVSATRTTVSLAELPLIRWKFDDSVEGYMPQFVPTQDEQITKLSKQWIAYQYKDDTDRTLLIYECNARAFWNFMCPALADVWMADSVTEGGARRHESLVYRMLEPYLLEQNIYIIFELPSGFHQIIPKVIHDELDSRVYKSTRNLHIMHRDFSVRNVYSRKKEITNAKRNAESGLIPPQEPRPNPAFSSSSAAAEAKASPSKTSGKTRYCIM